VGPGHLGSFAKPAVVVSAFADPLQEYRGAPVTCSDLCSRPRDGVLGPIHAGLLWRWRWDPLGAMVLGVLVPGFLCVPEVLRYLELQVSDRSGGASKWISRLPLPLTCPLSRYLGFLSGL